MVAMILTVLVVIYPLSPGPVALYYARARPRNQPAPEAVRNFYYPLGWLNEHSQTVERFYAWYFRLWGA